MTVRLHRDYETRGAGPDLKKCGVAVYAAHSTTAPWCMAYSVDDEPVKLWTPGQPCPPEFIECARNPDWVAVAHNDAFEAEIERQIMGPRFGWPVIPLERHRCTMVMAYAMALPGSLENAAAAVGMEERKDMEGRKVMMQLSKPRRVESCSVCSGTGKFYEIDPNAAKGEDDWIYTPCLDCDGTGQQIIWWSDAAKLQRLYDYCRNDVVVERELEKRLLQLIPSELELWFLDQRINDRGIYIDLKAVNRAIALVESEKARLDREMSKVTGGAAPTCSSVAKLLNWAKGHGADVDALAKADIKDALEDQSLPPIVRQAFELRREAAKSSTAKLKAMLAGTSADGRARGTFQFHAASTSRWGGRRIQTQNMQRVELLRLPNGDPDQAAIEAVLELLGK